MTGPYNLPKFMRKPEPLPGRGCWGCAGYGPFRNETAQVCVDCDEAQKEWRKEYARNYGLIRSRALAALRDRHPLEYADLLAQMRLGCDRPLEPPIPEAYFPDETLLIKLAAQRHSQPRKRTSRGASAAGIHSTGPKSAQVRDGLAAQEVESTPRITRLLGPLVRNPLRA